MVGRGLSCPVGCGVLGIVTSALLRRGGLCSRALGVVAGGRGLPGGVPAVSSSLSPPPVGCGVSARLAGDASFHFPYQLVDYQSSDATLLC